QDVAHSVAQDVAHDVAHDKIALAEFIKEKIRGNNKITRKAIADEAGVSVKTIERTIKEMDNLQYVGSGSNGHWELNE
ncbi:TPA: replication/maintenance protein RepL, partial [Streptococcus pyogenes]|nr:replication/maintenance protein RepL [Streptococcus pyogenes]